MQDSVKEWVSLLYNLIFPQDELKKYVNKNTENGLKIRKNISLLSYENDLKVTAKD